MREGQNGCRVSGAGKEQAGTGVADSDYEFLAADVLEGMDILSQDPAAATVFLGVGTAQGLHRESEDLESYQGLQVEVESRRAVVDMEIVVVDSDLAGTATDADRSRVNQVQAALERLGEHAEDVRDSCTVPGSLAVAVAGIVIVVLGTAWVVAAPHCRKYSERNGGPW